MAFVWCVTGAGHLLEESVELVEELSAETVVVFSGAGREVAGVYGLLDRITSAAKEAVYEEDQGYSSPFTCGLKSRAELIVVAPASANTVAKIASGVADSLVSNVVAQGLKNGIPVVVLPTDVEKEVRTRTPSGKEITLRCRSVDLSNVSSLEGMEDVSVARSVDELRSWVARISRTS